MDIGYTLMGEQRSPKDLVRDAVLAERAGFGVLVAGAAAELGAAA